MTSGFTERDTSRERRGRQKRACRLNMTRWMPCRAQGRFGSFVNYSTKKRVTRSLVVGVFQSYVNSTISNLARARKRGRATFRGGKSFLAAVIISEISIKKIADFIARGFYEYFRTHVRSDNKDNSYLRETPENISRVFFFFFLLYKSRLRKFCFV